MTEDKLPNGLTAVRVDYRLVRGAWEYSYRGVATAHEYGSGVSYSTKKRHAVEQATRHARVQRMEIRP
jgi:hypothetical protein